MNEEVIELLNSINDHLASIDSQLSDIQIDINSQEQSIDKVVSELEVISLDVGFILTEMD